METKIKVHKQTREDLIIELAKIRQSHSEWVSGDENRRIEFAKAFNWFKKKGAYDYQEEYKTPTWIEIFIEIGKLLEKRSYKDLSDRLNETEQQLFELKEKIRKEDKPQ